MGLRKWMVPAVATGALLLGAHAGDIVINEIHYAPDVRQERVEFVELYNRSALTIDLSGWRFTSGIDLEFPPSTQIPPGEYLVAAQDPSALQAKFGTVNAVGPWNGKLTGNNDRLRLVDRDGTLQDDVDFRLGFPWPTVGDPPGYSIELIHPDLDNSLGGNWRASFTGGSSTGARVLFETGSEWRYFKGRSEASTPSTAWREPGFDDSPWLNGITPIGYDPDIRLGTTLDDMRGVYTTVYLRKTFLVDQVDSIQELRMDALYDDGFKAWLNGELLTSVNLNDGEVAFNQNALGTRENNDYESFRFSLRPGLLHEGINLLAVQLVNISLGNSSDCFFDARLQGEVGIAKRGPTPGRRNSVFATNAPPAVRQVSHFPVQPRAGEAVNISARVSDPDGIALVVLEFQTVNPGDYIELRDPRYGTNWASIPMNPVEGGYTAAIPAEWQKHRTLVRYRIRAVDLTGLETVAPLPDDPEPNFAYFCYDGVPAWTGAVRPKVTPLFTVPADEMSRLPVYHLIATQRAVEDSTWFDRSHGDEYFWMGTLVYEGEVYDHVRFRPRGGVWRYAMGKNMWKFDFNRGHDFRVRDNWGREISTTWTKLNLGACIQQGDFGQRGEQGMYESVGFRLFQLAGEPAMHSTLVQLRVVDQPEESHSDDQYRGDFWGLYLAVEQPDGRFLKEHGMADGNFYKMEGGFGDPNNLGPEGPVDSSDLRQFLDAYDGSNYLSLTEAWWRTHLNIAAYYNYQAIVQAIHHYDIADGKNYFYHHDPGTGLWTVVPWDLDLTWDNSAYRGGQNGGDEPFKRAVLSNFATANPRFPGINRDFQNRVREIRDLLWNPAEAGALIDEYALLARGTNDVSFLDADRAQWDFNPLMTNTSVILESKAGQGRFYRAGVGSKTFAGMVQKMKNYVAYRASDPGFSLGTISADLEIPDTPTLSYTGPAGFPQNHLQFEASQFSGAGPGSVQWRVAEITRPPHPGYVAGDPWKYEIEPTWQSELLDAGETHLLFPAGVCHPGKWYRARIRFVDGSGGASHWSAPVEFTPTEPDTSERLVTYLRLTELMYHPSSGGVEFIELHNEDPLGSLDLSGAAFTDGIDFIFPNGAQLGPGGYGLVVNVTNISAFRTQSIVPESVPVFSTYSGSLDNGGERLTLKAGKGATVIFSLNYSDGPPWPQGADGAGFSLVPAVDGPTSLDDPRHWTLSHAPGGSPGRPDSTSSDSQVHLAIQRDQVAPDNLQLSVTCDSSRSYVLEVSANLASWTPITTNLGPAQLRLPSSEGGGSRFVRAMAR